MEYTAPLLSLSNLSIAYRRGNRWRRAVSDLTLEIARGEAYGLVGESGCGKTTAAMAVLRYLSRNGRIEAGDIRFDGRDLLALDAESLRKLRGDRIGMVYQHPGSALNPSLRIGRQIAELYTTHRGLDRRAAQTAAVDMLARLQIADPAQVAALYPHELSGGMQQRAVIAMALATDPDLLILDEPTTALDATVQAEILDLFAALRREFSAALLFISHNLGVVRQVCDRIGVMYAGELVEEGVAESVFRRPRHPYTAALLGCIPDTTGPALAGREPLAHIPGLLPEPDADIRSCRFRERCPQAQTDCAQHHPPLAPITDTRLSRCFHAAEVPEPRTAQETIDAGEAAVTGFREPLLQTRNLRLDYARTTVLSGVDLDIGRGETFGLVGESGSGKTTLAKLLSGLLPPDDGEIRLHGEPLAKHAAGRSRPQRRALQMVFQSPDGTLNPSHRIGGILKRAIRVLGDGDDTATKLQSLLQDVSLPESVSRRRPAALSGGQRQRVAIARAFAGSPELVILDEPTSALDVSVQAAILNLLAELQRNRGVSYLFITHDLAVVYHLAHRIGVMYLGELVEVGPTAQVFAPPYHPYTEALIAAAPRLHDDAAAPLRLRGQNPGAANRPTGCAFHTRCPHARDICSRQTPPAHEPVDGHRILCHIPPEELRSLQTDRR
ncbi:MAG: ABC transporter ATP-binding protein [Acidihalobacter sp.]